MPDVLGTFNDDPVGTLAFFLLVFGLVGVMFLLTHLLMGSVIRPNKPDAEKLTIYECGEPTVGSAWIQFDLRFYVVALLFVIFDVEVAFFFPWATVFGKANQLADPNLDKDRRAVLTAQLMPSGVSKAAQRDLKLVQRVAKKDDKGTVLTVERKDETGKVVLDEAGNPEMDVVTEDTVAPITPAAASSWATIAFGDILVFFGVLLVGFAYLWRRGDIDWVRAFAQHKEPAVEPEKPLEQQKVSA